MADDKKAQVELLTKAMIYAQVSASETPALIPAAVVQKWADSMYECGVRHTAKKGQVPPLPSWISAAVTEQQPEPEKPVPAPMEGKARVAEAPPIPDNVEPQVP